MRRIAVPSPPALALLLLALLVILVVIASGRETPPLAVRGELPHQAVSLSSSVRLYVPGVKGDAAAPQLQAEWTERSLTAFSELFGGATALRAEGVWRQGDALVREPVVIVYSYTTPETLRRHRGDVFRLAQRMAKEMDQASVAVEWEGAMLLLGRNGRFHE